MTLTVQELKNKINNKESFILLDVREGWEFDEGHIEGAINFSLYEIPNSGDSLEKYKNKQIIITCKSGARGRKAQILLNNMGFNNVLNLEGGFEAYSKY